MIRLLLSFLLGVAVVAGTWLLLEGRATEVLMPGSAERGLAFATAPQPDPPVLDRHRPEDLRTALFALG